MCKHNYGRMETYRAHLKRDHPGYTVEPEVFIDLTKAEAQKPKPLNRPMEVLTKQQLAQTKFRTTPAKGITTTGPMAKVRPILDIAIDLLKQDLALSDSDDTASTANSSEGDESHRWVDYKTLRYQSESTSTLCLDEKTTV